MQNTYDGMVDLDMKQPVQATVGETTLWFGSDSRG
jgi:hypothetical protein